MEETYAKHQGRDEKRMVGYFFDSYAVIEIVKGNPNYARYTQEVVIITIFNLVELYWSFLNELGEEKANAMYKQFRECVIDVEDSVLKEAIKFRKQHKRLNLSYTDCIGYATASQRGLRFLTGDKEFERFDNVEFVK